jgi:hypothetical protein
MPQRPQRPTKAALLKIPSSRLRLARGCAPPSGGLRPVRGGALPSSGLRLARGPAPPRAGSASLEGPSRPRLGSASLEGAPHACACPRTRAFNTLTPAGRCHHAPGLAPRCCRTNSPGGSPSPSLWGGTVQQDRCQSRDAVHLLQYGCRAEPSKWGRLHPRFAFL